MLEGEDQRAEEGAGQAAQQRAALEPDTGVAREALVEIDQRATGARGAQHTLAAVLELQGELDEALSLLRQVLKARPDYGKARYLFGKILLAQGKADLAAEQLEAAARVSPGDANVRYQLGRAYQALGRAEAAQQQFDAFQKLKDERRGPTS